MSKNDSGPAFPHMAADGHRDYMPGLSMRDWFAGMAMQGMLASGDVHMDIASNAYQYADAMLAERNK